jgi:hypothetical protein
MWKEGVGCIIRYWAETGARDLLIIKRESELHSRSKLILRGLDLHIVLGTLEACSWRGIDGVTWPLLFRESWSY